MRTRRAALAALLFGVVAWVGVGRISPSDAPPQEESEASLAAEREQTSPGFVTMGEPMTPLRVATLATAPLRRDLLYPEFDIPLVTDCTSIGPGDTRAPFSGRAHDAPGDPALLWLRAHQSQDGAWECAGFQNWCERKPLEGAAPVPAGGRDVGTTALGTLAFLGAGYTNRSDDPSAFGRSVAAALRYLKNVEDAEGCFGPRTSTAWMTDHAIASIAMIEVYGMTGSSVYKHPARLGLAFLLSARLPTGAWAAGAAKSGDGDAATTAWACLAIADARMIDAYEVKMAKDATFEAPVGVEVAALRWVRECLTGSHRTILEALLGSFGGVPTDAAALAAAIREMSLDRSTGGAAASPTWVYFAAIAARRIGEPARSEFERLLMQPLLSAQREDGDPCSGKGSWGLPGTDADALGAVGATALASRAIDLLRSCSWSEPQREPLPAEDANPAGR